MTEASGAQVDLFLSWRCEVFSRKRAGKERHLPRASVSTGLRDTGSKLEAYQEILK